MTKTIQIKNNDNNVSKKVFVHHQEKTSVGWTTTHSHEVPNMETFETHIWDGKRIVISESAETV